MILFISNKQTAFTRLDYRSRGIEVYFGLDIWIILYHMPETSKLKLFSTESIYSQSMIFGPEIFN